MCYCVLFYKSTSFIPLRWAVEIGNKWHMCKDEQVIPVEIEKKVKKRIERKKK